MVRNYTITITTGKEPDITLGWATHHSDAYLVTQAINDLGRTIDYLRAIRKEIKSKKKQAEATVKEEG